MSSTAASRTLALTHLPSARMAQGERTHVVRSTVDYDRAVHQHEAYCEILRSCGANVRVLNVSPELPDSVFVEDTAVVLDEVAVMASMGAESRRREPEGIEAEIRRHREVRHVIAPATIEGGDVLRVDRTLFVGLSSRTNRAGLIEFEALSRHYGYNVVPVPVRKCLHLKTACTALPDGTLLVNPAWIDVEALVGFQRLAVPETERWAANVAVVGSNVCVAAGHPRTADMIRARGVEVRAVDLSEFAKAEGGVTCLSILLSCD